MLPLLKNLVNRRFGQNGPIRSVDVQQAVLPDDAQARQSCRKSIVSRFSGGNPPSRVTSLNTTQEWEQHAGASISKNGCNCSSGTPVTKNKPAYSISSRNRFSVVPLFTELINLITISN